MKNTDIQDAIFRSAVEAMDAGNLPALEELIALHPRLLSEQLFLHREDYFQAPFLLCFIADNPIRVPRLPGNITEIADALITALKQHQVESLQTQLDQTLGLVVTGRIPKECGVQLPLIDLLINEGAIPAGALGALAHGNMEAARRLVEKGEKISVGTAVGLNKRADIERLLPASPQEEQLTALTVAAFFGMTEMVSFLLSRGVPPDGYPQSKGFHHHATPLHQAVQSGSMDCVKLLVDAGANTQARDKVYHGTPLEWAKYLQTADTRRAAYDQIAAYLENT